MKNFLRLVLTIWAMWFTIKDIDIVFPEKEISGNSS